MKLISIVGKEDNMDYIIEKYIINSGLQPEDALKVFEKGWKLSYLPVDSRPRENQKKCKKMLEE